MEKEERIWIKFYSKNDLGLHYTFEQSLPVLDVFDVEKECSINEILELYNIKRVFEAVDCPRNMDPERFKHYLGFTKPINSFVGRYFNSFLQHSVVRVLKDVDYGYVDDFLELLERFKVIEKIEPCEICKALDENPILLQDILQQKKWVDRFDSEISAHMRQSKQSAEIIIHHYLEEHESMNVVFHMPKSLSALDKVNILNRYIDEGRFHPNYVGFIVKGKSCEELPIDAKLRLKAEKAVEEYWRNNRSNTNIMHLSAQTSFEDIDHVRVIQVEGTEAVYKFDKKWIDARHDYPTLVWNLIHLLTLVDSQWRCTFVAKKSDLATERFLGNLQGKDWYHTSLSFDWQRRIISSQIGAYCKVLKEYGIEIEDLFEWYFNTYIKQNYGVDGFFYHKPLKQVSLFEKCRSLCVEIESILLQYKLFQENGSIDYELMKFINEPLKVGELRSLHRRKYIYGKDGDLGRELNSLLNPDFLYGTKFDLKVYRNFVQLLVAKIAKLSDFSDDVQKYILWLIDRDSVIINGDIIELNDSRYKVLKDLYDNQVASWLQSPPENRVILQDFVDRGEVDIKATLFSDIERDYYNFVMNHKQFSNSWNLRNKFAHGLISNGENLEEIYLELLKVFILVLIRIEEEFSLLENV